MEPNEIRGIRERLDMTRKAFAELLGTTASTLYRWETGASAPSEVHLHKLVKLAHEPREKWARRMMEKFEEVEKKSGVESEREREDWITYKKLVSKLYSAIEQVAKSLPFLTVERETVEVPYGYFNAAGPERGEEIPCLIVSDGKRRAIHFVPRGINYIGMGGKVAIRQAHPRKSVNFDKGGIFTSEGGRWVYFDEGREKDKPLEFEESDIRRLIENTFIGQS